MLHCSRLGMAELAINQNVSSCVNINPGINQDSRSGTPLTIYYRTYTNIYIYIGLDYIAYCKMNKLN